MNDSKSPLASTSVWGAATAIAASAAPLLLPRIGVATAADQQALVTAISQAVTLAGGVIALVGRLTATKRLR